MKEELSPERGLDSIVFVLIKGRSESSPGMYAIFAGYVRHLAPTPSRSLVGTEPIPGGGVPEAV